MNISTTSCCAAVLRLLSRRVTLPGTVTVSALAVVIAVSGCSSSSKPTATTHSGTTQSSAATSVSPTAGPSGSGAGTSSAPTTSTSRPADATAPTGRVIRSGAPATPSITAKVAPFVKGNDVTYPDGIAVTITGITQGQVQGSGPGVIAGPKTTFRIVFTNKSTKSIDMNRVVVSVSYGATALAARPVYDDSGQDDFAGTVAPGKSINAVYAFSIPTAQLVNVVLKVDFDGLHAAATFKGTVATR